MGKARSGWRGLGLAIMAVLWLLAAPLAAQAQELVIAC